MKSPQKIGVDFNLIQKLLIKYCDFVKLLTKM
jgi:hypothetical protein